MVDGPAIFEPLHRQIMDVYGTADIDRHLGAVLRTLIASSPLLTSEDSVALLRALDARDGESAGVLSAEWESAYIQSIIEYDDDPHVVHPAIKRAFDRSRLASAVAQFTSKDNREFHNFSTVMSELATGLGWGAVVVIERIQRELLLG